MKCSICGSSTNINWGNNSTVLCQFHANSIKDVGESDRIAPSKKGEDDCIEGPIKTVIIVISAFLLLIVVASIYPWAGFALLPIIGAGLGVYRSNKDYEKLAKKHNK